MVLIDKNFRFNLNYKWNDNKKNTKNLSLINIELVNNKNRYNYFNIYSSSYNSINQIAISNNAPSSYFNSNNELIIPEGIDNYIKDVISNPNLVSESDFKDLNYINDRRKRLTANNLIIGTSYSFVNSSKKMYLIISFLSLNSRLSLLETLLIFLQKPLMHQKMNLAKIKS